MQITIRQHSFSLSEPFQAGHIMSASEAQALNGLRAENIRNNMAKKWTLQVGEIMSPQAREQFQHQMDKYAENYQFPLRQSNRPGRDPLGEICSQLARQQLGEELRKQGLRVEDLGEHEIQERLAAIAKQPEIMEQAQARLSAERQAACQSLEELL